MALRATVRTLFLAASMATLCVADKEDCYELCKEKVANVWGNDRVREEIECDWSCKTYGKPSRRDATNDDCYGICEQRFEGDITGLVHCGRSCKSTGKPTPKDTPGLTELPPCDEDDPTDVLCIIKAASSPPYKANETHAATRPTFGVPNATALPAWPNTDVAWKSHNTAARGVGVGAAGMAALLGVVAMWNVL